MSPASRSTEFEAFDRTLIILARVPTRWQRGVRRFCSATGLLAALLCQGAMAGPLSPGPRLPAPTPDCVDQAAAYRELPAPILRAIGWHESRMREHVVSRNRNGTEDIGAFQINSIHLPHLARHAVDRQWLLDGCAAAFVAAWHLRHQVDRYGCTWKAVGAYHSTTPTLNGRYGAAIARLVGQTWPELLQTSRSPVRCTAGIEAAR